jgi:FtsH-binding integral membrane protein
MRIFYFIVALIVLIFSISNIYTYTADYEVLSSYGKGYVWGSIILFVLSILFFYLSFRKKKK